ncbi:hypothetical protein BC332_23549 [Capsicum chinense]|nr:hypothetical protein BC332_23549 [Capsicum chinense]
MFFNLVILVSLFLVDFVPASCEVDGFIYNGFQSGNISLDGIANLTSNGLLLLTDSKTQDQGHAFYPNPIHFKNSPNGTAFTFSTTFVFTIRSDYRPLDIHGLDFVIAPQRGIRRALANHYLGLFNSTNNGDISNHIVRVELDTIYSADFDYMNDNHVGIDINGLKSLANHITCYFDDTGLFHNMTLVSGQPMQVWVDYDCSSKQINVTIAPLHVGKPVSPLLSLKYVLSPIFYQTMYVGFSSSNGSVPTNHYILGWSFKTDVVVYYVRRKKFEELLEDWEREYRPQRFNYKDLYKATKEFKEKELLGAGGFGKVYKGVMPITKLEIAVKKISHESRQVMKEFVLEIVSIGRMQHRNVVPLLGYCRRKRELLLVYEYMSNESLDKDIKASNILLDGELNGRLGDFGLARLYGHGTDPQSTRVVGTLGYLAPEHTRTGRATPSSDVFSFGAFLLEVACGTDFVPGQVELVLSLGLFCSHSEPSLRPTMRQNLLFLDGVVALPELSTLGVSSAGLTFDHPGGFDDFIKSYPCSSVNAHSCSSSVAEFFLSDGR